MTTLYLGKQLTCLNDEIHFHSATIDVTDATFVGGIETRISDLETSVTTLNPANVAQLTQDVSEIQTTLSNYSELFTTDELQVGSINGISDNDIVVNHNMNFSGHFIKEIADGVEPTDAISKQQLDAVISDLNTIRDNLDKLFQYFFSQDSSFSLPVGGGNGRSE